MHVLSFVRCVGGWKMENSFKYVYLNRRSNSKFTWNGLVEAKDWNLWIRLECMQTSQHMCSARMVFMDMHISRKTSNGVVIILGFIDLADYPFSFTLRAYGFDKLVILSDLIIFSINRVSCCVLYVSTWNSWNKNTKPIVWTAHMYRNISECLFTVVTPSTAVDMAMWLTVCMRESNRVQPSRAASNKQNQNKIHLLRAPRLSIEKRYGKLKVLWFQIL